MGMDITMYIIDENKIIAEDIFPGRNRSWFDNMMGEGEDEEYNYLPAMRGIPAFAAKLSEDLDVEKLREKFYFGFHSIKVCDYIEWYRTYKPDIDAGWVTTYDKWCWEHKCIMPEDVYHTLPEDARIEDWHFIEFYNDYDNARWLFSYLVDNQIPANAYIVYYFDN